MIKDNLVWYDLSCKPNDLTTRELAKIKSEFGVVFYDGSKSAKRPELTYKNVNSTLEFIDVSTEDGASKFKEIKELMNDKG